MTVSSENRRNDYDGNGVTDTFPFKFMILRPQDLRVVQADAFGAETELVLGADYTVSGVGVATGGEITLTAGPLPVGHHLTLLRNMQLLQSTDLRNQGKYAPETVETALDRIVMTLQQQQEEIDRSLKVRATSQDHPDSLIESVKESEAAAAASAVAAGQSAQSAADSAQQAADTLDQSIQEADAILAAAGLPNPIVPNTGLWAAPDGSGYQAVGDEQMLNALGIPAGKPTADPATPITGSLLSGAMLAAGALVEQGENANGSYWRWESGLQVCLYWDSEPFIAEPATGGSIGFSPTKSVSYPAVFASRPIAVPAVRYISGTGTIWGSVPAVNFGTCQIRLYSAGTSEAYVGYVALGWWK